MFGTITFSQMPVSVLVSANSCLYAGRSATDARNWIALLTSCIILTLSSSATYCTRLCTESLATLHENDTQDIQKAVAVMRQFQLVMIIQPLLISATAWHDDSIGRASD